MKLRSIDIGDDENPQSVTVTMTTREAAFIAKAFGKYSPKTAGEFLPGFDQVPGAVYACLVGDLFNRFWDNGVDDAIRELSDQ